MFGERDTVDSFATIEGAYSYSVSDSEDEIIPNAEGNVGLSFVVAGSHPGPVAEITLGYHAEAWFDINNTEWDMIQPLFAANAGPGPGGAGGRLAEEDGDQYIHGPFVRIGIRR